MKSELQKAADRVRKLQESKPPIVEAMKAANDMLGVRQQEMEQAAFNLRTAQRGAYLAENAYKEHERKILTEIQEVRALTFSGDYGVLSVDKSRCDTVASDCPY